MKRFFKDEEGVSLMVEYVLLSLIAILFLMIISINSDAIFIENANDVVIENQFSDVGNMMSTMITDMYVILPANGKIEIDYTIPAKAGKDDYIINADIAMSDQIIEVISLTSGKKVRVTIGGIANTMPINGTASSSASKHVISYDSRR